MELGSDVSLHNKFQLLHKHNGITDLSSCFPRQMGCCIVDEPVTL